MLCCACHPIVCRKPEALKALQRVRNGTTVYIGDNPIARKMRLRLIEPQAIPGTKRGTVSMSEDAREPATTTLMTRGIDAPPGTPGAQGTDSALLAQLTNTAGEQMVDPLSKEHASSVFIKMMRHAPDRPMLAKSLLDGIFSVRKSISKDQEGVWKMDENAGERLMAVFDELHVEIENWNHMETVVEETESAVASLAGESDRPADAKSTDHDRQHAADTTPRLLHPVSNVRALRATSTSSVGRRDWRRAGTML